MFTDNVFPFVRVDEVGIHTAQIGPFLLKSTFLPVYRLTGNELRMAAVVGGARFQIAGRAVAPSAIEQLPREERVRAVELGRVLVALNRGNTGRDGLDIVMPGGDAEELRSGMLGTVLDAGEERIAMADIPPARLVCELPPPDQAGLEGLARFAAECRRRNVGVAIRGFAGSEAAMDAARALGPEIITIDGRWFRQIAGMPAAARLLPPFFRGLHGGGARVHIGGLDDAALVGQALQAGANLVSGAALAAPLSAGAHLGPTQISAEAFERRTDNVVPLFG